MAGSARWISKCELDLIFIVLWLWQFLVILNCFLGTWINNLLDIPRIGGFSGAGLGNVNLTWYSLGLCSNSVFFSSSSNICCFERFFICLRVRASLALDSYKTNGPVTIKGTFTLLRQMEFSIKVETVTAVLGVTLKIVSEYTQKIPQLQTADKPTTPQGRAIQQSPETWLHTLFLTSIYLSILKRTAFKFQEMLCLCNMSEILIITTKTLWGLKTPKWVLWQTVKTQMKRCIRQQFIRVCTVC